MPIVVFLSWIFDFTAKGIKKTEPFEESENENIPPKRIERILKPSYILNAVLVIAVIILAYPKIFKGDKLNRLRSSDERISVAVMPFLNLTNDTTWNIWQEGIQFNLISSLSGSSELKVKQTELTNSLLQSKGYTNFSLLTPSVGKDISKDLDANVFIYGTVNKNGEKIRIGTQLIDSKTEEVLKSFHLDGRADNVLNITDSLSFLLRSYLVISRLKKEIDVQFQNGLSNSIEASKNFILGYKAFNKYDNLSAIKSFTQAIKIDSNFILAYFWLSMSYANQGMFNQAEKWALEMNKNKDKLSFEFKIWANLLSAKYVEKSKTEELKFAKQLLETDERIPSTHWAVGLPYYEMHQYNNAIPEFEKTLDIYHGWNTKPMNAYYYEVLVDSYHETARYQKEKELLSKAKEDFPNDPGLIRRQIILSFNDGDTTTANINIQRYVSILEENSISETEINLRLAQIYWVAGYIEKAEENFRQALNKQPENPLVMNNLAYFLIESGRNLTEGLRLAAKALKSDPGCYECLDTEGWGLYETGKFKEALEYLQKAWDLKPVYNHRIFLHLGAAKKAVAGLKNY